MGKKEFYSRIKGKQRRGKKGIAVPTMKRRRLPDANAAIPNPFYSTTRWRKNRAAYRAANPLCELNYSIGKLVPAGLTHHIVPIDDEGDQLDSSNLMSLASEIEHRMVHTYIEELRKKGELPFHLPPEEIRKFFIEWYRSRLQN